VDADWSVAASRCSSSTEQRRKSQIRAALCPGTELNHQLEQPSPSIRLLPMRIHVMRPEMMAAYGIRPHSNMLFATGAASLFRNCSRIFGSLFSTTTAFCFVAACCESGGCSFCAFRSSQLEF
jgi:hypothetical protein